MTLRLHDTAARTVRAFVPVTPGQVSIYVCGATVQSDPHIGHVRSAIVFDILRRWLTHRGWQVTFVRNVTDIDDKILTKSAAAGVPWWAWAYTHERAFDDAYRALGVADPTYAPRATGHVPEMIALMRRLIDAGHAYATDAGDVYFDVRSWDGYGSLSRQQLADMHPAADSVAAAKRDPRDFALWKSARSGPTWDTPWGAGRPGWHLECSAMAEKYCGGTFDIHGGGMDLIFPHHENEIAQSQAAGDGFANYWMHNGWVTLAGEKMSKSLGNSLLVSALLERVRPIELRYYLGSAHYRSMLEYSPAALDEAAAGLRRVESFVRRAGERVGDTAPAADVPAAFAAALDDDLGVPAALAVVHQTVTAGNEALGLGDDAGAAEALAAVRAMAAILGIDPGDPAWQRDTDTGAEHALDALVRRLLEQRAAARAGRDFAAADAIRDQLQQVGLVVQDGADGSSWTFAEPRG